MRRLAGPNRILYVESFSGGGPMHTRRREFKDLCAACAGQEVERLVPDVPGLYRYDPSYVRSLSTRWDPSPDPVLMLYIAVACSVIDLRPNLLWLADPRAGMLRRWLVGIPTVYQVEDALATRPYAPGCDAVAAAEDELISSADAVLCGSRPLYLRMCRRAASPVHYVPHGIDYAAHGRPSGPPGCLAAIARPIAGFCGLLTRHHDTDLLVRCARQAHDISFVIAGSSRGQFGGLKRLANVHWLEQVAPHEWPALLQGFDVCLLPLRAASWMASACPPQLLPYLACGRPIVSTPVPHVRWLAGPSVSLAGGPAEFVDAIRWELAHDTPDRAAHRQAIAAEHDWSRHSKRLAAALNGVAGRPGVDALTCIRRYFASDVEYDRKTRPPRGESCQTTAALDQAGCLDAVLGTGTDVSEGVERDQ